MSKSAAIFAAVAAMLWLSGCADKDPVSSQNERIDSPAGKLVVSSTKAGSGLGSKRTQVPTPRGLRVFPLPKLTQPPVLDGNRFSVTNEWANALEQECSPSQVLKDGARWGANELAQSAGEAAAVAQTDADYSATIWQAWDDDALYYIAEVRDNAHDVTYSGEPTNWWERDSMSLYVDLNNENSGGDCCGFYTGLNIVNFVAAPPSSSSVTRTLETTVAGQRQPTTASADLSGFTYGFRDAGNEFGGTADYIIEGKMTWDAFMKGNLNQKPTVGTKMGYSWLGLDPDGDADYGGQLQCVALATNEADFANWFFVDTPAGPDAGSALKQDDAWGRVQATFTR